MVCFDLPMFSCGEICLIPVLNVVVSHSSRRRASTLILLQLQCYLRYHWGWLEELIFFLFVPGISGLSSLPLDSKVFSPSLSVRGGSHMGLFITTPFRLKFPSVEKLHKTELCVPHLNFTSGLGKESVFNFVYPGIIESKRRRFISLWLANVSPKKLI